jgi:hypothetical protein
MATTAASAYDIVKIGSMAIDGNLDDWQNIATISMADNSGRTGGVDNTARVKLAWNEVYLYAAYDVTDTELLAVQTTRDHGDIYLDDEVELYIDPQGDGGAATSMTTTDYQFLANVRDAVGDKRGNGAGGKDGSYNATSFLSKAVTNGTLNASGTDVGYVVELRISWSDLGVTPTAGHSMRMDLAVGDRDVLNTPAGSAQEFDWAGVSGPYNNPSAWNEVQLVDRPPPISAYDIVRVSTAMAVDGNLGDWAGIASISMADTTTRPAGLDNTAKVRLAWDPTHLYFAYDVTDTELLAVQTARDNSQIFLDDAIELYIDPQGDGWAATSMTPTDYQFLANVREALGDLKGNGAGGKDWSYNAASFMAQAVLNGSLDPGTDVGYAIEGRISWTDLGVIPAAGSFMRIDPAVDDRDAPGTSYQGFDWAGLTTNWNNPSAWKDVKLVVDAAPPAAPTNPILTVVSSSEIDVSWTASTSSDVAKYNIYRATTGTPTLLTSTSATPYHDTGLTAGTSYTYQVSAVDAAGNESPKTAPGSATTPVDPVAARLPLGVFGLYSGTTTLRSHTEHFDLDMSHTTPANIRGRIANARTRGLRLELAMTGGSHENYKTGGVFDLAKWKAKMDEFDTDSIRDAVADAVEDGIVVGASVLDEPNHASWGPEGTFDKAKVDALAAYVKGIFPTLPVGYGIGPRGYLWRPDERYEVIDYIYNQYNWWIPPAGNAAAWRDNVLEQAELDGVNVVFGLNILDGGIHVFDGGWTCPPTTTGGQGTYAPACAMTAAQVEEWGSILGVAGLGLSMWTREGSKGESFFVTGPNATANRNAILSVKNTMSSLVLPVTGWARP